LTQWVGIADSGRWNWVLSLALTLLLSSAAAKAIV
jgi:hypothetical protein